MNIIRLLLIALLLTFVPAHARAGKVAPAVTRTNIREGFIAVTGGRVWYRVVGVDKPGTPIILLHGGPGGTSDPFEPLEALADERPVVMYDQLGSGRADRPEDKNLYRVERYVEELKLVREALGLKSLHVYGHSWGSMLAVDYMLAKPEGVRSLILAGPCLSATRWAEDQKKYLAEMPKEIQETVARNEKAGTTQAPEYQAAVMEYYKVHLCRTNPFPLCFQRGQAGFGTFVYEYMWGPSEFTVTGTLKDYERVDRLHEIKLPTLFTCGQFDEATPASTAYYQSMMPGAKLHVFENCSHMTYDEAPEKYVKAVRDFIHSAEKK